MCKPLFKSGIKAQGKVLVKVVTMALSLMDDEEKFNATMIKLAETHNEKGIKAAEYGIMGEALFWALRMTLGDSVYTIDAHRVWVRIYSRMIRVIVPVAVAYEMRDGASQSIRFGDRETINSALVEHTVSVA